MEELLPSVADELLPKEKKLLFDPAVAATAAPPRGCVARAAALERSKVIIRKFGFFIYCDIVDVVHTHTKRVGFCFMLLISRINVLHRNLMSMLWSVQCVSYWIW